MNDSMAARPAPLVTVTMTVNGRSVTRSVEPRTHLIDFLRNELDLTGSHLGCEHGVCGACTVRVDGDIVRGCLVLAVQLEGARVETIEGISASGEITDLQEAFVRRNALQCGYCTPGMLMCAAEFLRTRPSADREAIRDFISGNYCRCTGYHAIVDAIAETVEARRSAKGRGGHR
ncbi:MAG: (2Fe-2S)-binding protein [Betaproteobacteria bacterium RIFCSPLOWO2_12_FULL_63_13]|nr:MAG: (2Fe-2S)-binding protein [Betaproteobacteria bacterium RIFCSPLOWO2_02_FULL_63_19]OGA53917.1 MAG: (2Fe-2S)-binding protein [Betaproteobacteria bacterium RIFCSPLOWO2_12_FULL_63_13]